MNWKKGLALGIGAGAAGWLGVRAVSRRTATATGAASEEVGAFAGAGSDRQEYLRRSATLAQAGAKAGGNYAAHRARRVFAGAERREELDRAFELQTAEQITETLGNMKGAMMKLGQMVSYLDAGLPPHVREAFAQLQSDAPPMSPELAAGVVESELGAPPTEVFAEWDPTPIASASIGQVHRAMTRDGRAVAVKVQYPGIDKAIRSDLQHAHLLFSGMGALFPGLEPGPVVEELKSRIIEELDYAKEATNQQAFVDAYAGHPTIVIPEVVHELSTTRVLTTELADGVKFDEMLGWPDDVRNRAAETIFRFVFRSLYRNRAFNGDPHPGNYLFREDGSVVFLDFGLVKRFTEDEIGVFSRMIEAFVLDQDPEAFRVIIEEIGLLADSRRFDDDVLLGYFGHFYEWVQRDQVATITPEYASESIRRYFDANGPFGEIIKAANMPPSFVLIQRINLGLFALLADMGATANWRRLSEEIWPFVDGPPSTELGTEEAAWAAERRATDTHA